MAEEANTANQRQNAGEPHGEPQSTDWEAKYREPVAHSREWEKRTKDNKAAADELQQLKESQMSEAQKAAIRAEDMVRERRRCVAACPVASSVSGSLTLGTTRARRQSMSTTGNAPIVHCNRWRYRAGTVLVSHTPLTDR
ncbi:hypothetical protein [Bifidobacterium simiarum]|uniref:hypothetical protein n=1 Tax=Bifidobacterium simiarum TaxID=2045441 RepID=UPI0010548690|nr:hypothetical protein [Bifidobacterium simiarum]